MKLPTFSFFGHFHAFIVGREGEREGEELIRWAICLAISNDDVDVG